MDSIKLLKKRINSVANKILETNILGGDGQGAEVPDAGPLVQEMPSLSEIDRQFEEFMNEVNITDQIKRQALKTHLKPHQKWEWISKQKQQTKEFDPQQAISMLQSPSFDIEQVEQLRIVLTGASVSWLKEFIELNGLLLLFSRFQSELRRSNRYEPSSLITEYALTVKAIVNTEIGIEAVLENPKSLETLTACLPNLSSFTRANIIELLSALCLISPIALKEIWMLLKPQMQNFVDEFIVNSTEEPLRAAIIMLINVFMKLLDEEETTAFRTRHFVDDIVCNFLRRPDLVHESMITQLQTYCRLTGIQVDSNGSSSAEDRDRSSSWSAESVSDAGKSMGSQNDVGEYFQGSTAVIGSSRLAEEVVVKQCRQVFQQIRPFPHLVDQFGDLLSHLLLLHKEGPLGQESWKMVDNFILSIASVAWSSSAVDLKKFVIDHFSQLAPNDLVSRSTDDAQEESETTSSSSSSSSSPSSSENPSPQGEENLSTSSSSSSSSSAENETPEPSSSSAPPPPPPPPVSGGPPPPPPPPGSGGPPPPPPPPGSGGPPPPPPPGSSPNVSAKMMQPASKLTVAPSVTTSKMNWTKLAPTRFTGSIWESLDDSKAPVDFSAIEEAFKQVVRAKPVSDGSATKEAPAEAAPKAVNLLDSRRSQNLMIVLSRFRMKHEEIRDAIWKIDLNILNLDNISTLLSVLPDADEIATVKAWEGDDKLLVPAEQFVRAIADVPRLHQRLSAIQTSLSFLPQQTVIFKKIDIIARALHEIRKSDNFREFLQMALAVGNFLNSGTARGSALGFRISSLPVMMDLVSTTTKSKTMVNILLELLDTQANPIFDLLDDFPTFKLASLESMKQLRAEVNDMKKLLSVVKTELEGASAEDPFRSAIGDFNEQATKAFDALSARMTETEESFAELKKFFGEDESMEYVDLMNSLNQFFRKFEAARVKILREKTKKAPASRGPARGVIDVMITQIRSGSAF